jgi:CcmD family protein
MATRHLYAAYIVTWVIHCGYLFYLARKHKEVDHGA